MNEETLWVLKMLSEKRLSAKMANRLLYALEVLKHSEENEGGKSIIEVSKTSEEMRTEPDESNQVLPLEADKDIGQSQDSSPGMTQRSSENADLAISEAGDEASSPESPAVQEIVEEYDKSKEKPMNQDLVGSDLAESDLDEMLDEQQGSGESQGGKDESLPARKALETSTDIDETFSGEIIHTEVESSGENQPEPLEHKEDHEEGPPEISKYSDDSQLKQTYIPEEDATVEALPLVPAEEQEIQEQIIGDNDNIGQDESDAVADDKPVVIQENGHTKEWEEPVIAERKYTVMNSQIRSHNGQGNDVFLMPVDNDTDIIFNNENGNLTIQGWDQKNLKIQGNERQIRIYQEDNKINIDIDGNGEFLFYLPVSAARLRLFCASGKINVDNHNCDMFVSNGIGDIYVKNSGGSLKAKTTSGNIAVEDYKGNVRLQSESGSIVARKISNAEDKRGTVDSAEKTENNVKHVMENNDGDSDRGLEISVQTESGDIALEDISGSINARGNGEIIRLRRCRGCSIVAESRGAKMDLKDVATDMVLIVENGEIMVEDFFGNVKIDAKNTNVTLMKSGDAQIYVESDNSDIKIEDCYADANINSGKGDVYITGGNLSFAAMGKVELKIKDGNAYLNRRTFEDIFISIEEGNAEVNMEKLNSGGSSLISTNKGNITLRLSPKFQFDLTAKALRKKIRLDLPVNIIEKNRNSITCNLNGGGAKISLAASEGEVSVQALED